MRKRSCPTSQALNSVIPVLMKAPTGDHLFVHPRGIWIITRRPTLGRIPRATSMPPRSLIFSFAGGIQYPLVHLESLARNLED